MVLLRSILVLAVSAMTASAAVTRHPMRTRTISEARDVSNSDDGSLEASLDYNLAPAYFSDLEKVTTWQPTNITLPVSSTHPTFSLSEPLSFASPSTITSTTISKPVTITITGTGRPIATDEILIGLIATLALLYSKGYEPLDYMPAGGVRITFNAGLRHTISLEPLRGQRVTWGALADAIKQTGNVVRVKNVRTEFIFTASYAGSGSAPWLRGIVANPSADEGNGDQVPATS